MTTWPPSAAAVSTRPRPSSAALTASSPSSSPCGPASGPAAGWLSLFPAPPSSPQAGRSSARTVQLVAVGGGQHLPDAEASGPTHGQTTRFAVGGHGRSRSASRPNIRARVKTWHSATRLRVCPPTEKVPPDDGRAAGQGRSGRHGRGSGSIRDHGHLPRPTDCYPTTQSLYEYHSESTLTFSNIIEVVFYKRSMPAGCDEFGGDDAAGRCTGHEGPAGLATVATAPVRGRYRDICPDALAAPQNRRARAAEGGE